MKEEKIDRIIRKTFNDKFIAEPSSEFSDNVMEKLGVKKRESTVVTKPLKPRRGLLLMGGLYILIIALVFFLPGSVERVTTYKLPEISLPAISKYLNFSSGISRLLIVLILGGWALIFFDNYIRKLFMR
jgi:hypothetical protein